MADTPIADMIEKMLAQQAPMTAILIAVRTYEMSRTNVPDIRGYETARKRIYRSKIKDKAKANDVAIVPDLSRTVPDNRCDLSSLTESVVKQGIQTGKKQPELMEGREKVSRGTRISSDWQPDADSLKFAAEAGMRLFQVDQARNEFVDFWLGIPGARGRKIDWQATWRNRVRDITGTGGKQNGRQLSLVKPTKQHPADLAAELAEQARELERQAGIIRPPSSV